MLVWSNNQSYNNCCQNHYRPTQPIHRFYYFLKKISGGSSMTLVLLTIGYFSSPILSKYFVINCRCFTEFSSSNWLPRMFIFKPKHLTFQKYDLFICEIIDPELPCRTTGSFCRKSPLNIIIYLQMVHVRILGQLFSLCL